MATKLKKERSTGEGRALSGRPFTYEEFLRQYEGVSAEWVDGWVELLGPFGHDHQALLGFLSALIRWHVEDDDLGKILGHFRMSLNNTDRVREPDLLFVATENLSRLHDSYLEAVMNFVNQPRPNYRAFMVNMSIGAA